MALLLALLAHKTNDSDPIDYTQDYEIWIGRQPPGSVPRPERQDLALESLYNILHYEMEMGSAPSKNLGTVLATLLAYNPIATPSLSVEVKDLRAELRDDMVAAFKKLTDASKP